MLRILLLALLPCALFLYPSYVVTVLLVNTLVAIVLLRRSASARDPDVEHAATRLTFLDQETWNSEVSAVKTRDPPPHYESPLRNLPNYIISEFVALWFRKISPDTLFQESVAAELDHVTQSICRRLAQIDVPSFLCLEILPVLTKHYEQTTSVARLHDSSYSIESKITHARQLPLHPGVTLSAPGPGARDAEKAHFRELVQKVLPYLLSAKESNNGLVSSLVSEILACTVLTSVVEVVAEGDFFNQMIVKFVGANLKHRDQVKRLRAALEEHTSSVLPSLVQSSSKLRPLESPISDETVQQWMDLVKKETDLCAAREALMAKKSTLVPNSEHYLQDSAAIVKILAYWNTFEAEKVREVLMDPKKAEVFREFLRAQKLESEIDLWQTIEKLKAPLEDSNPSNVRLYLEFSNRSDIITIHQKYLSDLTFDVPPSTLASISKFVQDPERRADQYQQARASIFEVQKCLFTHLETRRFPEFRNSSRFGDLQGVPQHKNRRVASTVFPRSMLQREVATLPQATSNVSSDVVEAVGTAFERIMDSSDSKLDLTSLFQDEKSTNFASDDFLFDRGYSASMNQSRNRLSSLFENVSEDDYESDTESLRAPDPDNSDMSNLDILLAGPGDLTLSEKISKLEQETENLYGQSAILESLLKKAELTNNVTELKVLKRSLASVEREITSKELQKQQYIVQENENSLFGKSKVTIQSCVNAKDENLPYVLYIIEVQKFSSRDPTQIVAGWVVARRFRQFHKLNQHLKRKYPEVKDVKFPKKSVPYLKFQQAQQIEVRKPVLEKYLQELLKIPAVCADLAFRCFLSSEDFVVGRSDKAAGVNADAVWNLFYRDVGHKISSSATNKDTNRNKEILANLQEMERELKQFDEINSLASGKVPFVKPISDFLLTVFDLSNSSWLRGRALLVVLHQVLGSTIEKSITENIDRVLSQEDRIAGVVDQVTDMLFPGGKFREAPEVRTKAEQTVTRQEAFVILQAFMKETCSKVFGSRGTNVACSNVLELMQNDFLNKHLILEVFDRVLVALFPEIAQNMRQEVPA